MPNNQGRGGLNHVKKQSNVRDIEQQAAPRAGSSAAVTAVERLLDIFEAFQRWQKPLSLTDLAEMTGIPKSSCHAIVNTLIARGYLYSLTRPRALYPTRRFFDVTRDIHDKDPFVERVVPLLERLRNASHETIILGKRQGDAVIYLQVIESTHAIRYTARPGEFKPLHSSAIGKALLGSLKEADMRAQVARLPLPAITEHTLTVPELLAQEIVESRRRGYFVTRGENVADVWAVAAFFTVHAETLAIAIAGPRHRMEGYLVEMAQLLLGTCGVIARQWA
jgi:IclR family acetate operon transcriptional repressor